MNRKTIRKVIIPSFGLLVLVAISVTIFWLSPFIDRESHKKVELYVNPVFKISNYDSFYAEYEDGSVHDAIDDSVEKILTAGGLSRVYQIEEITPRTLYITLRIEKGLILPPYFGHINPQLFFPKTLLVEIFNNKSKEQLLLKFYTWRGVFNDGYGPYEYNNFLIKGLSQAGWKEKKYNILLH